MHWFSQGTLFRPTHLKAFPKNRDAHVPDARPFVHRAGFSVEREDSVVSLVQRLSQGPFIRPSQLKSLPQRPDVDAQDARPFRNGMRFAIKGKRPIRSFVVALLLSGAPSDVARFVVAVVVDAIQFMLRRWTGADLAQYVVAESFEIKPSRMNRNAASSVVLEPTMARIPASLFHAVPAVIQRSIVVITNARLLRPAHSGTQKARATKSSVWATGQCTFTHHPFTAAIWADMRD